MEMMETQKDGEPADKAADDEATTTTSTSIADFFCFINFLISMCLKVR